MNSSESHNLKDAILDAADRGYVNLPEKHELHAIRSLEPANSQESEDALTALLERILS